ncbi:thermonuclease family protein [Sulfitobacter sp. W074]|uniref:thermonuclease family protein n=1 Tax=Sulfitobacter sp. W074 TaxID=2867026 RepID=UPI0021A79313|nr:thermonuclease family protein [Sulfitobacter sp. W074]UWR39462.1 thermonuclease family protein [Sulfitobacter sp. W074]
MEIIFIILAIVVVAVLWVRHGFPRETQTHSSHRPEFRNNVRRRRTFNTATAQPVPTKVELEGPAYVVDGDTIVIQKTQIRLFGVDAPELNHPFGKKAKWALVSLCKGHQIRAEITAQDDYGRTVAKCYLPDGRDLSAEMTKLGLAIDWPKFSGGAYRAFETQDVRKKLWLAHARQKGHMQVWEKFEAQQAAKAETDS